MTSPEHERQLPLSGYVQDPLFDEPHDHTYYQSGKLEESLPININHHILRQAIDEVVGESVYTPDYDWQIWHHLQDLEAENGLPEGVTAEDLYQEFNRIFHYED